MGEHKHNEKCHVCRFVFYQIQGGPKIEDQKAQGICRRFPPSPTVIPVAVNQGIVRAGGEQSVAMVIQTAWPAVNDNDWCGEFERPFSE